MSLANLVDCSNNLNIVRADPQANSQAGGSGMAVGLMADVAAGAGLAHE